MYLPPWQGGVHNIVIIKRIRDAGLTFRGCQLDCDQPVVRPVQLSVPEQEQRGHEASDCDGEHVVLQRLTG